MSVSTVSDENSFELVLDSWPVIEWLKGTGSVADIFSDLLTRAEAGEVRLVMSRITVGEVFYVTAKAYGLMQAEELLDLVESWSVLIVEATGERVLAAARFKGQYPISHADALVATLGFELRAPVLTGDSDFLLLQRTAGLRVEWLGA